MSMSLGSGSAAAGSPADEASAGGTPLMVERVLDFSATDGAMATPAPKELPAPTATDASMS